MRRAQARLAFALALAFGAAPLGTGGCGYSTQPIYLDSVRTVAVPIFDNTTDRRLHEFDLTNAVVREIHSRTPIRVAPPERADAVLNGRITHFLTPALVEGSKEAVLESSVTVTLQITLTERATNKVLLKDTKTISALFSTRRGETFESASAEAIEKLARWVVQRLEKAW